MEALLGSVRLAACAGVRLAAGLACRRGAHRQLAGALRRLGGPVMWARARVEGLVRRVREGGRRRGGGDDDDDDDNEVAVAVAVAARGL